MSELLTPELILAYLRTCYRVETPSGAFDLRVGRRHPRLDGLLSSLGVKQWGFLTAENPRSRILPPSENAARNQRLHHRLLHCAAIIWPGEGVGDDSNWTPEKSYFVAEVNPDDLRRLAADFEQHAALAGAVGEPAFLIFPDAPRLRQTLETTIESVTDSEWQSALRRELLDS